MVEVGAPEWKGGGGKKSGRGGGGRRGNAIQTD